MASGLAERYTVYEFDRRGRGASDEGGALALEAAAQAVPLRAVVVYEPPFHDRPQR